MFPTDGEIVKASREFPFPVKDNIEFYIYKMKRDISTYIDIFSNCSSVKISYLREIAIFSFYDFGHELVFFF